MYKYLIKKLCRYCKSVGVRYNKLREIPSLWSGFCHNCYFKVVRPAIYKDRERRAKGEWTIYLKKQERVDKLQKKLDKLKDG